MNKVYLIYNSIISHNMLNLLCVRNFFRQSLLVHALVSNFVVIFT